MEENQAVNSEVNIQQVIENNKKLAQMAENLRDVLTELRQINSDKELQIAELKATIKRFEKAISGNQAAPAPQTATEEEEVVEEAAEEVAENEDE